MPNYESDSDTEYIDEYYDSIIYNGEEKSTTKYNIISRYHIDVYYIT